MCISASKPAEVQATVYRYKSGFCISDSETKRLLYIRLRNQTAFVYQAQKPNVLHVQYTLYIYTLAYALEVTGWVFYAEIQIIFGTVLISAKNQHHETKIPYKNKAFWGLACLLFYLRNGK